MNFTKEIIKKIIIYIFLIIIFGIILNWVFVIYFGDKIRSQSIYLSPIIILIFIIIIPISYIYNIKNIVTTDLVKSLIYNYKNEFASNASIYITNRGFASYQKTKENPKLQKITHLLQNNKGIINFILGFFFDTGDILEKVNNLTSDIDRANSDSTQVQNLIEDRIKSQEFTTKPNIFGSFGYILCLNLGIMAIFILWFYKTSIANYFL